MKIWLDAIKVMRKMRPHSSAKIMMDTDAYTKQAPARK